MSDDFEIGKAVKNLHNLTKVGEPVASLQATRLYSDKPNTPCEAGMCQHCEGNGCRCTCHVSAAQPAAGTTLEWTAEEIENFHKQASQPQPEPSEHLIRAMSEGTTPQAERPKRFKCGYCGSDLDHIPEPAKTGETIPLKPLDIIDDRSDEGNITEADADIVVTPQGLRKPKARAVAPVETPDEDLS